MVKPIPARKQLPTCVNNGEKDVWWFNSFEDAWYLGIPLLMDFTQDSTFDKWTHWLPETAIPFPE